MVLARFAAPTSYSVDDYLRHVLCFVYSYTFLMFALCFSHVVGAFDFIRKALTALQAPQSHTQALERKKKQTGLTINLTSSERC
jgi:hypothetical protein